MSSNRRGHRSVEMEVLHVLTVTASIVLCSRTWRSPVEGSSDTRTSPVSSSMKLRHSRWRKRNTPTMSRVDQGTGRVERSHEHLVQAKRIDAVLLEDVVRVDGVLQRLPHLPVHPGHGAPLVRERVPSVLDNVLGRYVHASLVLEGVGEDVALVEQASERFRRAARGRGRGAPCARSGHRAGGGRRARHRQRRGRRRARPIQ